MKQQIILILLFTLFISIIHAELSDQGFIMSDIEQTGLEPFDFVVSSTELTLADQAISFQFHLNYDTSLFTYNGYETGSELPGMLVVNDLNPGVLNVAWANSEALVGALELITFDFTPLEPATTQFTLTEARYNNTEITNIIGGNIEIIGIPEVSFEMENYSHQGLTAFDVSVTSSEISADDEIISYQFCMHYDAALLQFSDFSYDANLTGELVVNAQEPGLINAAYAGADPITGINELINVTFLPLTYGYDLIYLSETVMNNFIYQDEVESAITVYPAWEEMAIEVTGADVFTGDQFTSNILTTPIMLENEILSFQFVLNYDSELMEYAGIADNGRLTDFVINDTEPGVLQVAYASSDPFFGEGLIIGFLFNAISDGNTQIYLSEFVYNNTYITNLIPGDVLITNPNFPPVADAGDDFEIFEGDAGMLNGTGSYDPNDDEITYFWEGELVLDDATIAEPSFTAPEVAETTEYLMTLTVDDGEFQGIDEVIVTVVNIPNPSDAVITVESLETIVDEEIAVGIFSTPLDAEFGVISYQYILNYDPDVLTYTGYDSGIGMPDGQLIVNGTEPGIIQVAFSCYDPVIDPEALNFLNFTADVIGETQLTISDFYYNNDEVNNLEMGNVIIHEPFYYIDVYAEDLTAGIDLEFTCNVITEELLPEWNIISYQFHLYYDPEMLEFTGYQLGDVPTGGSLLAYELEPGHISVAFADYNALEGAGALAGFNFIPLELGETVIEIDEFKYNATYLPEVGNGNIDIIIPYTQAIISAPELTVGAGESFIVGISTTELMAEWGAIAFQFDMGFDAELMEFTGYQYGSILDGGNLIAHESSSGTVTVAYANYMPLEGEGTLVELEFTAAMELGQSELDISGFKYNSDYLADENQIDGMVTLIEPYTDAVITCSDADTREGLNFTVGISTTEIQEEWEVISFQFDLGFDTEYVEYVGYTAGDMITTGQLLAFENESGNLSVAFADYMPLDGVGELVELEFTAILAGETTLDLHNFKYNALYMQDDNQIDGNVFIDLGNYPPIAIAGEDQIVDEGDLVELNGLNSYDPDDFMRTPNWTVNPAAFEYTGNIWGLVEVNEVPVDDVNDMIGVFVGEECRGIAQSSTNSVIDYMGQFGHIAFMPTVYSNVTSGETLTFKYYDASANAIYDVDNTLEWVSDMTVGNGFDPFTFIVTSEATPNWSVNPADYEYTGNIWGTVEVNEVPVDDVNDMIGVFVGEECRGIAQSSTNSVIDYMSTFGHIAFMPTVYSNVTSGETLTFKYYDASANAIYNVDNTLEWESDMTVGNGFDPFTFIVTAEAPPSDLIFNWIAPDGVILDDPTSPTPSFTAPWVDEDTDFVIGLEVSDGEIWSEIDEVVITVIDHPIDEVIVSAPEFGLEENTSFFVQITTTTIQEDMNIISYQFTLAYDPFILQYNYYTPGELSPNMLVVNNIEPGIINVAYADNNPIVGAGNLVVFDFTAIEGGVSPLDIQDFKYNNVYITTVDGYIDVLNVNDTPIFDLPAEFNVNEDEILIEDFSNYIIDPDNDTHDIIFSGNTNILIDIDGYNVTFSAPENWFGSEIVTFIANDNVQRDVAFGTTTINFLPVNDPPVLDVPPVMYFDEDGEMIFNIGDYVYDVDNEVLYLEVTGMVNLLAEVDGLVATITATENWFGNETLTFTVDDQMGRSTAVDFCEFIVEPMNDTPTLDLPEYISFNEDEELIFDISPYADDIDMDVMSITSVLYDEENLYNTFEGMEIDFTAAENWFGITEVTVTITDNVSRDFAEDVITVEVLSVNDTPEITLPDEFSFNEDESSEIDFAPYLYDVEGDELILTTDGGDIILTEIENYMVTFSSTIENWHGQETIFFAVNDQQGRAVTEDSVNVVVIPVNDEPVISEYLPLETQFSYSDTTQMVFSVDYLDVDDDVTVSWYMNENLLPGISDDTLPVTFDHNGFFIVTIEVYDGEILYATNSWEIDIWMGPDWQPVVYPSSTTAYTRVTIDGNTASELDMVGAFVDGELRGWSYPFINQGYAYATIVVYGVEIEEIEFMIYDYSHNEYYNIYDTYTSDPGGEIGTPPNFINLNFGTGFGPNWTPVVYTSSTIVYGSVTIEGVIAEEGDRVGCFVGPECRAVADVVITTREDIAVVTLNVQGETPEIAQFKVWDVSEDDVIPVPATIVTNPGGQIGNPPDDLIEINATYGSTIVQSIDLLSGWNLMSLNVYPEDYQIADIFAELIANEELVKVKDIFNSYDPTLAPVYNTLNEFEDGHGYYVRVSTNTQLEVEGLPVDPEATDIPLNAGWNLVGYLPQVPQDLESALVTIMDQLLKIKDTFNSYDPTLPPEFNTLSTLVPGTGYWIKMFSPGTLTYQSGISRYQVDIVDNACPIWEPVIYTNSTITYGNARLDGTPAEGYIAAFVDEECRAAAPINNGIVSLVVNGDEAEEISFKLYNNGVIYDSDVTVISEPGNDISDMRIEFTSGDVPVATKLTSVYPNPFNPETTIEYELSSSSNVEIKVYNSKGQLVETILNRKQTPGTYQVVWNADDNASGIYFLRFISDSASQTQKIILMK